MKKNRGKTKAGDKDPAPVGTKVVRLKPARARASWISKIPSVRQYWVVTKNFIVEAAQELKKVTWPSRKETVGATGVVLLLVVLLSIYLGMVDYALSHLVRTFIH